LASALIWQFYRHSLTSMRNNAVLYTQAIAYNAEDDVLVNDRAALQRLVDGTDHNETVQLSQIVGHDGDMVVEYRRHAPFTADPSLQCDGATSIHLAASGVCVETMRRQMQVSVPIMRRGESLDLGLLDDSEHEPAEGNLGTVRIVYSLDHLNDALRRRVLSSICILLGVIVVGVLVTVLAMRQLLRPVHDLVESATSFAHGRLQRRASEKAPGELGLLATVFNRMADTLAEYTTDLESQVQERTATIERYADTLEQNNHKLREANAAAEASNLAKSEFLANMSHEIRTPMTAIVGFAEQLNDAGLSDADRRQAVDTIQRNGRHLVDVINDILDLSKIEAGKLEVDILECSPAQIVCDVASLIRVTTNESSVAFRVRFASPIPSKIQTDPMRLRQILFNLLSNAVKFTEHGKVEVKVRLVRPDDVAETSEPGPVLEFSVCDTGIGMTSEQVTGLFQSFHQADSSMSRRYGGTGLGLAISKKLANMLGGDITVDSEYGVGSTFTCRITTGSLDGVSMLDSPTESSFRADNSRTTGSQSGGDDPLHCRVLLAEDGPDNRRLISHILKKAGATVVVAENGQLAVERVLEAEAAGHPFDVILMDMQMPIMDGYEATRTLRLRGFATAIIALTAHAMTADRQKCLDAGCDDYATKPIDRRMLVEIVRKHLATPSAVDVS